MDSINTSLNQLVKKDKIHEFLISTNEEVALAETVLFFVTFCSIFKPKPLPLK
jgi:hypothetical protein